MNFFNVLLLYVFPSLIFSWSTNWVQGIRSLMLVFEESGENVLLGKNISWGF